MHCIKTLKKMFNTFTSKEIATTLNLMYLFKAHFAKNYQLFQFFIKNLAFTFYFYYSIISYKLVIIFNIKSLMVCDFSLHFYYFDIFILITVFLIPFISFVSPVFLISQIFLYKFVFF